MHLLDGKNIYPNQSANQLHNAELDEFVISISGFFCMLESFIAKSFSLWPN